MDQIQTRVDEGAVEVENNQLDGMRIEAAIEMHHKKKNSTHEGAIRGKAAELTLTSTIHLSCVQWGAAVPAAHSSRNLIHTRTAQTGSTTSGTAARPSYIRSNRILKRCSSFPCRLSPNR